MDREHKVFLRSNYMKLSRSIAESPDSVEHVAKYLSTEGIISQPLKEEIVSQRNTTSKVYMLLDILPSCGPRAFKEFYNATVSAKLLDVADILEPSKKPHQGAPYVKSSDSEKPIERPLPVKWPCTEHQETINNGSIKVVMVDSNYPEMIQKFHDGGTHYNMTKPKRGKALIIDNKDFDHMREREGTEQDSKGLKLVLQQLGFDVSVEKNKSKDESEQLLDRYCEMDHSHFDCFILLILSHGISGKVCCTDYYENDSDIDAKVLEISKIRKDIAKVPSLTGKPKLIFIQACQGNEPNMGMKPETSPANTNSLAHTETGPQVSPDKCAPNTSTLESIAVNLNSDRLDGSEPSSKQEKVPAELQDVFLSIATTEDYTSFRRTDFGTWFIQALVFVLANYAFKEDLKTLMTKVTKLVTTAKTTQNKMEVMQVSEDKTTLTKDFFFFPGLP